jgi:hypothetical protein
VQKVVDGDESDAAWRCIRADELEIGVKVGYYLLRAWDVIRRLPPPPVE